MATVERQVHGYRQGHQLLAASVRLSKEDQSTIDRLSDVAGALRPREHFKPYLTAYPLPNGKQYVLARTWQDLTVARAGCVRTLSLIFDVADWATAESIWSFLELLELSRLPVDDDATTVVVPVAVEGSLLATTDFQGSELLEALFLENKLPVVVFDAPEAEIVAVRLLTALWPSLRRKFALSTFALSPRKVGGRDFDLVFAPKDARSKFADWPGRRIDAQSLSSSRHRWTGRIASRVFSSPQPRLLTSEELGLVGGEEGNVQDAAALRIALLWEELLDKLKTTPTALLGLLDIASSGKVRDPFALRSLEPLLESAVRHAAASLPDHEAWNFLGAITRKLHGKSMPAGAEAVRLATSGLAGRSPEGAVTLLMQPDEQGAIAQLIPAVSDGIARDFSPRIEKALLSAPGDVLGRLIINSQRLARRVTEDRPLIERLAHTVPDLEIPLQNEISEKVLPLLLNDWQLSAAVPMLERLSAEGLVEEVKHLSRSGQFVSPAIAKQCIVLAREKGAKQSILSALVELSESSLRDTFLADLLEPSVKDSVWLITQSGLSSEVVSNLLVGLVRKAGNKQLAVIFSDNSIKDHVINAVELSAPDILHRVFLLDVLPLNIFIQVATRLISLVPDDQRVVVAHRALERSLGAHFEGNEVKFLATMLGAAGGALNGAWAVRVGLSRGVAASVVSRNLVAFRKAPKVAWLRIVWSVNDVAEQLRSRQIFDLDAVAARVCADILLESEKVTSHAAISAANQLLPMLMRQRTHPVSSIVAAAFPIIYRELRKKDEVPDLLKMVPFFDWDRSKAARQELVSTFMSSAWDPGDLALTACRCDDVYRILRRAATARGGDAFIKAMLEDIDRLPDACQNSVRNSVASIWSDLK